MMYPVAMRHVMVELLSEDLPAASLAMARTGEFHPDSAPVRDHDLETIPGERFRLVHQQARARLEKILEHLPELPAASAEPVELPGLQALEAINERLGSLWAECSASQERLRVFDEEERQIEQLVGTLALLANIGVNLRSLDRERRFLDLRVGSVSRFNLDRLRDALGLARFIVYPFMEVDDSVHVVIAGPRDERAMGRVKAVLESAAFRDLPVPTELRDDPDRVRRHLAQRRSQVSEERQQILARIERCALDNADFLRAVQAGLALSAPFVEVNGAARASRQVAVLSGWVPAPALGRIDAALSAALPHPFLLRQRPPRVDELGRVPTLLPRRRWLAPFTGLVQQFGIPGYREIDPSIIFSITFLLMFGMMFGDVGHGAVIAVAALVFRARLGRFTWFGVLAGLSSMGFGWVYGSVFGYEHWVHPLWVSPMSDPVLVLRVALGWGVGFLVLMTLLSVHNRFRAGDFGAALMDTHGAINLPLYGGLLWMGWDFFHQQPISMPAWLAVLGALAVMVAYKWRHLDSPPGERVMVVAVECFEAVMGNISGTLSFLRVAAFSINHVALALAVFTLAGLMQPVGHGVMVVAGNLFILILEGAIVAIQALRLEYYEGFSRFFGGQGREFNPLVLDTGTCVGRRAATSPLSHPASDDSRSTP